MTLRENSELKAVAKEDIGKREQNIKTSWT